MGFEVHTPADLPQVWNLRYLLHRWHGGFQSQSRRCNEKENLSACSQSTIGRPGREVGLLIVEQFNSFLCVLMSCGDSDERIRQNVKKKKKNTAAYLKVLSQRLVTETEKTLEKPWSW